MLNNVWPVYILGAQLWRAIMLILRRNWVCCSCSMTKIYNCIKLYPIELTTSIILEKQAPCFGSAKLSES